MVTRQESSLKKTTTQLSYLPRSLKLTWEAAPVWTITWLIMLAVQGLLPAAVVYLTRLLVDNLVVFLDGGPDWANARPVIILAGVMAAALLLTEILKGLNEWVRTVQAESLQDHLSSLIHDQALRLDLAFYESPAYHDLVEQVSNEVMSRPLALLENSGSLLQNGITLAAIALLIIPYGLWLPLVLILSTLPALAVALHYNRRYHHWWKTSTPDRRRVAYYHILLTHSSIAAEVRLFDLGHHFKRLYQTLRLRLRHERISWLRRQGLAGLGAGILAVISAGLVMVWMVWQVAQGLATLGDLVLFYQAFSRGQTTMRLLLTNLGRIHSNGLFLANLFEFLQLQPQIVDPPQVQSSPARLTKAIRFQNVTFCYPGSIRPALHNFNLIIPAGRMVALVGSNGAGKSTLIKLLCRFYDPQQGRIEWDGIDLREISVSGLHRLMTVLFQFPVPYHFTAGSNIALGDVAGAPALSDIKTAARNAGAHDFITNLPYDYDTPLGKWFANGTELSGGEWQRLALARAFIRQAPLVILDEPTSFMDSWAEVDWLARFRQLTQGRTALIITHRFTTAMQADMIHVMDHGQIVESGTHAELLALGGRYAQSWTAQMQAAHQRTEAPQANGHHASAPWV
ncbi:MAG: ABC transporter ATP-binding protein [Anaerolineae bacterium]|nr:ABC transporter ATP-binding protein [Anaerolineae bacterium]